MFSLRFLYLWQTDEFRRRHGNKISLHLIRLREDMLSAAAVQYNREWARLLSLRLPLVRDFSDAPDEEIEAFMAATRPEVLHLQIHLSLARASFAELLADNGRFVDE